MSTLQFDLDTLVEDYETVLALEAIGTSPTSPIFDTIRNRWCLTDTYVARESTLRDVRDATGSLAKDAAKGALKGAGKLSSAMLSRFAEWGAEKEKSFKKKFDEVTSKASKLMAKIDELEPRVARINDMPKGDVSSGDWTAKICVEDKLDFDTCVKFADNHRDIHQITKAFTTYAATLLNDVKVRKEASTELRKVGKSTGWAVKRGAQLLGLPGHKHSIEGWALPGNVIVILSSFPGMMERVGFAVARSGDYDSDIPRLTKSECEDALKAAYKISETLRDRHVKSGLFSYKGVYKELDSLKEDRNAARESTAKDVGIAAKQAVKDGAVAGAKAVGKGAKKAKQMLLPDIAAIRYNNALAVEDALSTAQVRVVEGLLEYVRLSIK